MKILYTLSFFALVYSAKSQTCIPTQAKEISSTGKYLEAGYVAFATPKKDTLFVQKDHMGFMIKTIWDNDSTYTGPKPKIVMVENLDVIVMTRKKKKNSND